VYTRILTAQAVTRVRSNLALRPDGTEMYSVDRRLLL